MNRPSRRPARPAPTGLTRRRFVAGAGALAGAWGAGGLAAGGAELGAPAAAVARESPGSHPPDRPERQHAWQASLAADGSGNPVAPRHQRLILLDVAGPPTRQGAATLEAALRALERHFRWGPEGLLFCLGWSPAYFEIVLGRPSPVPAAIPLAPGESPALDTYHACLHLAADDGARLAAVEAALFDGARLPGIRERLDVRRVLRRRATRTGFVGAGLPAAHRHVTGVLVAPDAPLFMGFASGRRRNQASEDAVTISGGRFAGGTTMHVSLIELNLSGWYRGLSERGRVARMFAPELTVTEARRLGADAASDPGLVDQAARRYGMVGHAQAAAVARRGGRPVILRRDFNTVDGGRAGVHFVALQRTIEDFVTTRAAVNAPWAQAENPRITQNAHNGINAYMTVRRRANYLIPPRRERSFPLV